MVIVKCDWITKFANMKQTDNQVCLMNIFLKKVQSSLLIFMLFLSETLILLSTTRIGFGWTYGSLDFSTLQT